MSEQTQKIIQLIEEGKSCNEICFLLHLSNRQLFHNLTILKNKGFFFQRKYYANGVIKYSDVFAMEDLMEYHNYENASVNLITDREQNIFRFLVISDLHFGNPLESVPLTEEVFNYAIKNDIHIILCCGDIIDGDFTHWVNREKVNIYSQIEHFIHDYPFDPYIITIMNCGNHDQTALTRTSQDLVEIIRNYRHDIVLKGYGDLKLNIKNDMIYMTHKTNGGISHASIVFRGHSHRYLVRMEKGGEVIVTVPSLCYITETMPTFLDCTITFNKGLIQEFATHQVYFSQKPYSMNEVIVDFSKYKNFDSGIAIRNVETMPKEEFTRVRKVLRKKNHL